MPKICDIPRCPAPPISRSLLKLISHEYQIELATPLFGGGVEAGQPDQALPIRGTAIRGQLQFWWRATCGAKFKTYKELYKANQNIWGSTEKPSSIEIEIKECAPNISKLEPCAKYLKKPDNGKLRLEWNHPFNADRVLPYALFPFQGQLNDDRTKIKKHPTQFIGSGLSFVLKVRYPQECEQDLDIALRAWVNFGGLGARTRRGCGALFCKELAIQNLPNVNSKSNILPMPEFKKMSFIGAGSNRNWPTFAANALIVNKCENPMDAWRKVIEVLQHFRHGKQLDRNGLAIQVCKRGEGPVEIRANWSAKSESKTSTGEHLLTIAKWIEDRAISNRVAYDLYKIAQVYKSWPVDTVSDAIQRDTLATLRGKQPLGESKIAEIAKLVQDRVVDANSLFQLSKELLVARQIAVAIAQAKAKIRRPIPHPKVKQQATVSLAKEERLIWLVDIPI